VTAKLRTDHVAYFQRKIQLSRFSSYPDGLSSLLIRISGFILYFVMFIFPRRACYLFQLKSL